jgi:tetratricopeptide (TPR) repeat protein
MKNKLSNQNKNKQVKQTPFQNVLHWQLFILFATLTLYFSSFSFEFVNWDDPIYIYNNPFIHSLSANNISNIFRSFYNGNYHPLTMVTYAIENAIAGQTPFIYHFTNVILHLANTLLVFVFVQKLMGQIRKDDDKNTGILVAGISSLLFGVHPFHVESVSWISERKDVLYTFFFLIALMEYLRYVKKPKLKTYLITIFIFLMSLLSKGMAVTFSVSLIAIDYLLSRDLLSKKVIIEKIPFLFISVIFGIIAIKAQEAGDGILVGNEFSFFDKLVFSSYGLSQYILKLFVPFKLCHYYPYPAKINGVFPTFYFLYPFFVMAGLVVLYRFFRKSRVVVFGIMFFLINIFLVLKIIPVGDVIMADRYTYVSSIGVFFVIALFFEYLFTKNAQFKGKIVFVLVIYFLFLGVQTHQRTKVWETTYTLWNDANSKFPNISFILLNRGLGHIMNKDVELAMKDYKQCVKLDPNNFMAYSNMANVELSKRNFKQAIALYTKSLAINANNEKAYCKRGEALINIGKFDEALTDLNLAIKLNSAYTDAYRYRGTVKFMKQDYYAAIKDFNTLIGYDPNYAEAYYGSGLCYLSINNKVQACKELHKAADLGFKPALSIIKNICQ